MIHIYLCDDNEAVRHRIQTVLEQKICIENWDMAVSVSTGSARSLLDALKSAGSRHGIYFLDVDLRDQEWDGFLLGQEIRRQDPYAILVYITNYGDLSYRTFQYHLEAFDYIVKDPEQLEQSLSDCLDAIQARLTAERVEPAAVFTFRSGDLIRHIPIEEILFFETSPVPHHVLLHTANSRIDFLGSLNEIEVQMGARFLRVHRAFLVAADKIEAVDPKHGLVLVGGQKCCISRAGRALLRSFEGQGH